MAVLPIAAIVISMAADGEIIKMNDKENNGKKLEPEAGQSKDLPLMENENDTGGPDHPKGTAQRKRWMAVAVACVAVMVAATALLLGMRYREGQEAQAYEQMKEEVVASTPTPEPTNAPTPTPLPEVPESVRKGLREPDKEIDFKQLAVRNGDVIAWVTVPGTEIDYPVMRGIDNDYYLHHDIDNEESVYGVPFLDMGNEADFSERISVIYGHNMKNGSMFAGLHEFEDTGFFEENREIKLYTGEGMRVYEIFAANPTGNANILYENDYSWFDLFEGYVESVNTIRDIDAHVRPITVEPQDQILILSTCVRGEHEQRYVLQGKLVKEDEAYLE